MKKIYLAGFDVFFLNAKERGEELKEICKVYGYEGLYPLDNEVNGTNKNALAQEIFKGNINLIKEADIIIANLNNFRGLEPDSGTSFECGIGYALGKRVYGYVEDIRCMVDKYPLKKELSSDVYVDDKKMIIENFNLPLNLMLSCSSTIIEGTFEDCLKAIEKIV